MQWKGEWSCHWRKVWEERKERKKSSLSNPRRCISGQTHAAYTIRDSGSRLSVAVCFVRRQRRSEAEAGRDPQLVSQLNNSARRLHQFILGGSEHAIAPLEGHHGNETQQHDMSRVTPKK